MSLLKKLAPEIITVRVAMPYGKEVDFIIGLLTYHEWMELEGSVLNPAIPRTARGPDGHKVPNPGDVKYQREVHTAFVERQLLLVAKALMKGGEETGFPSSDNVAENADWLRHEADAGIVRALYEQLRDSFTKTNASRLED